SRVRLVSPRQRTTDHGLRTRDRMKPFGEAGSLGQIEASARWVHQAHGLILVPSAPDTGDQELQSGDVPWAGSLEVDAKGPPLDQGGTQGFSDRRDLVERDRPCQQDRLLLNRFDRHGLIPSQSPQVSEFAASEEPSWTGRRWFPSRSGDPV